MAVHSGGSFDMQDLEKIRELSNIENSEYIDYAQIESSTSSTGISNLIKSANTTKIPLIFFSTYNSAKRIEDGRISSGIKNRIKIIMNDEAQYLVQERFHDILHTLASNRCYFFTATIINTPSDEGRGMNNKESYGDVIYSMTPREAIDRGKMVRPRMHFVITKDGIEYNKDDYQSSLGHIIEESLLQHQYALKGSNPKILVSVK